MRIIRIIDQKIVGFFLHWHLYRMLTLEFAPFFIGGVFVVVLFMGGNAVLFNMLEHIVNKHIPAAVYVKVLLLQIPTFMVMGLPMATIFGALMAFGRLSRDNELDAMRTSRIVAWRILIFTVLFIGAPIAGLDWYMIHRVVPRASRQSLDLWKKYLIADITGKPMANVFFQGKDGVYFFISSFNPESGLLSGVTVYTTDTSGNPYPRIMIAPAATWDDVFVTLQNGRVYDIKNDGMLRFDSSFKTMRVNIQQEIQQVAAGLDDSIHAGLKDPRNPQKITKEELLRTRSLETDLMFNMSMNLSPEELREQIKTYKNFGISTQSLETNLFFKMSIPFSCLVCIILAVPVSIGGARAGHGTMRNIVLILLLMTCYYISTIVAIALGHSGTLLPWQAAWLQNIVFTAIGAALAIWYMRK